MNTDKLIIEKLHRSTRRLAAETLIFYKEVGTFVAKGCRTHMNIIYATDNIRDALVVLVTEYAVEEYDRTKLLDEKFTIGELISETTEDIQDSLLALKASSFGEDPEITCILWSVLEHLTIARFYNTNLQTDMMLIYDIAKGSIIKPTLENFSTVTGLSIDTLVEMAKQTVKEIKEGKSVKPTLENLSAVTGLSIDTLVEMAKEYKGE